MSRGSDRPALDDDALMMRVAGRDALAFSWVAEAHASMVHRIAYRMLIDGSEAEDMVQEALLRLWTSAGSWQPGRAGIAAWLQRVTMNLCLDRLRRRRFVSDEDVPEQVDGALRADERMELEQTRQRTVAAIAALSDRQRAAIVLTYYEEQPNAAAAAALDMNLKAFESLLLRARTSLKTALTLGEMLESKSGCAA